jgi:hypothetical protein
MHPYALGGDPLPQVAVDAADALLAVPGATEATVHAGIADALVTSLPSDPDGAVHWHRSPPYVRTNLAGHAMRGGVLDRLVADPGFLLAADPALLLPALDAVSAPEAVAAARAYRRATAYLRDDAGPAAAALQLAARRTGAEQLADRIGHRTELPWSTRWLLAPDEAPHQTVGTLPGSIIAVWAGRQPDGTPVAAAISDAGAYGCWELPSGDRILTGSFGPPRWIRGMAGCTTRDGRHLVAGVFHEQPLTLWELVAGAPVELDTAPVDGILRGVHVVAEAGDRPFVTVALDVPILRDGSWYSRGTRGVVAWWTVDGDPPRLIAMDPIESSAEVVAAGRTADGEPAIVFTRAGGGTVTGLRSGRRTRLLRAGTTDPGGDVLAAWTDEGRVRYATADGLVHRSRHVRHVTRAVVTGPVQLCGGADGVLRTWDLAALATMRKDPSAVSAPVAAACATLSSGQRVAVVAHRTGALGVWDRTDGFVEKTLETSHAAVSVAAVAPPGGPVLAVSVNQRGHVHVSDVDSGRRWRRFLVPPADPLPGTGAYRLPGQAPPPPDQGESLRAVAVAVTVDGTAIAAAVGHRGWLHRWEVLTGRELTRSFLARTPEAVACTRLGDVTVTVVATGNHLMVYDLAHGESLGDQLAVTGELLRGLDLVGDIAVAFDTGRRLHRWRLSGTAAGVTIEALGEPALAHHDVVDAISCGRLGDGTPVAVTGARDGTVRVWNVRTGRMLHHIPVEDAVTTVALADDLDLFVGTECGLAVFRLGIA